MDYQQAARLLRIDKHRLDDELETHSDCMCQVSDAVARANTVHLTAKDNLAKVEASATRIYHDTTTQDSRCRRANSGRYHSSPSMLNLIGLSVKLLASGRAASSPSPSHRQTI